MEAVKAVFPTGRFLLTYMEVNKKKIRDKATAREGLGTV